jgi:hypothetical protein
VNTQNYDLDRKIIRDGDIADGVLEFTNPAAQAASDAA